MPLNPTNPATQLFSQALSLSPPEREEIALLLWESLPGDAPVLVDEDMEQQIVRRLAERGAGVAKLVDLTSFSATVRSAAKPPGTP